MFKLCNGFIILSIFTFTLFAETHITGDITGMTFESGGNPYIVEQDILIPAGSKAVIKDGCIFLFKPFTGLTVHGHLVVTGTQEQPVVFSSINDGDFNTASEQLPNPFDWNGILISRESGTVTFKNFALRFSVYGIKSQNTNIILENGLFRQNGQFHFTINDKIQFVQDNIAYSYNGTEDIENKKPPKPPIDHNGENGKPSNTRLIIRYSSLGVGVLGTIGGIIYGIKAANDFKEWDNTSKLDVVSDSKTEESPYDKAEKKFYQSTTIAVTSGIIGILGYTGFGLTYVF